MGKGLTTQELNEYFGIKKGTKISDAIIRRPELPYDEFHTTFPFHTNIPYNHMIWLGCPICTGEILIDGHMHKQKRICEKCGNVYKILRKGQGRRSWYEYVYDNKTRPEPWMRATL
jgi:hypothetical protein